MRGLRLKLIKQLTAPALCDISVYGCTSAFHAEGTSSNLVCRSRCMDQGTLACRISITVEDVRICIQSILCGNSMLQICACNSVARVSRCQREGRGFESRYALFCWCGEMVDTLGSNSSALGREGSNPSISI